MPSSSSKRLSQALLQFPGYTSWAAMRLTDIDTGQFRLQSEHKRWLKDAAATLPLNRNFHVYIFGYASKLAFRGENAQQSDASNVDLSFKRASEAAKVIETANPRATTRIDQFMAEGNHDYVAPSSDDSATWRAVEVHMFLDDAPPPPPHVDPPPCSGGRRYRKWSVATPGGFSGSPLPGAVVSGNVVAFRLDDGAPQIHYYVCPGAGVGFSWSGPSVSKIWDWIKTILGIPSYSGMSWSPFSAVTPFNFGDLSGATCKIESASAGVGPGYQKATVSVDGQIWFRDSSGNCMFGRQDFFMDVDASGKDLQFGAGGSVVGGVLIRAK